MFLFLTLLILAGGCAKIPKNEIAGYALGPKLSPDGNFVVYAKTYWDKSKVKSSYLKMHDLASGEHFTIAGNIDDLIWHPLEQMLYFLTDHTLYEINPDNFTRSYLASFERYDPPGEISLYGWLDGETLILKQHLPEERPSGSYVILYNVVAHTQTSRYFAKDEEWEQLPSGNEFRLTRSSNDKVFMLKDGKPLKKKLLNRPIPHPLDYYSLEIKYGDMDYEMPLLANGDFQAYQHFWDVEKERLFFASKNYFWRLDLKGSKLNKLGVHKNVQKGIIMKWGNNDQDNPAVVVLEENIQGKKAGQEIQPEDMVRGYFKGNELVFDRKGNKVTFNIEALPELEGLINAFSQLDIAADGDKAVFSHAGRVGYINLRANTLDYLSAPPRMKLPAIPSR